MKSIAFILFVALTLASQLSRAQSPVATNEDDIILKSDGKNLTITITDPQTKKFDLLIYKSYEEIMFDQTDLTSNPIMIDISTWKPGIYHLKIDYNRVTQFRHYEVIKD